MQNLEPEISVVIPTRNRGEEVVAALESVLKNTHPNFEVILVDQSTNPDTEQAVHPYRTDHRFRYLKTDTVGAGLSRNIGIANARGEIIAFTDDDCIVPLNWLDTICALFNQNPGAAVLFCSVLPAPHDFSAGTIPHHVYQKSRAVRSWMSYVGGIGMAAGMAARTESIRKMGGFDRYLGPGSLFKSGEDHDLALRTLARHWEIYETCDVNVVHYGYRTLEEFRELTRRDWIGIGAAQAKILKCLHWGILPLIFYNILVRGFLQPISNIFRLKKPSGFKRIIYFFRGFIQGLKTPVDPQLILYHPLEATK